MFKRLLAATATLVCLSTLAACGNERDGKAVDPGASDTTSDTGSDTESEPTDEFPSEASPAATCEYFEDGSPAKEVNLPPNEATVAGQVEVTFETSLGDIAATLDADATPCTVNSFISLAEQGYFEDTPCHRLTTSGIYVLQCGDPTGTGMGGPGYRIEDEVDGDEKYVAGTLAMAKTPDPDSGGSQFFLVYDDSLTLPPDYTVFGTISAAGVEILRGLAAQGTDSGAPDGPPSDPVDITAVTIG